MGEASQFDVVHRVQRGLGGQYHVRLRRLHRRSQLPEQRRSSGLDALGNFLRLGNLLGQRSALHSGDPGELRGSGHGHVQSECELRARSLRPARTGRQCREVTSAQENDRLRVLQAAKRQAAPHSRGTPKDHPKRTGRKAGRDYGQHACRLTPSRVDETIRVPLPAQFAQCGGGVELQGSESVSRGDPSLEDRKRNLPSRADTASLQRYMGG
jgi:hypothetical protein